MANLTRRRNLEASDECWHIYFGDVHVGTIAIRTGNPHDTVPWQWDCGFYPGSLPRERHVRRLAGVGKARQHHRCLEIVHARLRSARSQERQWNWVQWQVRDNGWTPWRLEYVRLARARVNAV